MRWFVAAWIILYCLNPLFADTYPDRPIDIIVSFGKGGSTDRMVREMAPFLEEAFGQPIRIENKKGMGTQVGAEIFLERPQDGYTIFATAFSPYLPNTILNGDAAYDIEDFELINIQWFAFDFIAVHEESPIKTLIELLASIHVREKPLKVAVLYRSLGHLNLNLLLEKLYIPRNKIQYIFFEGGKKAREALVHKEVDCMIISAQGSESIRKDIRPLAVISDKRAPTWDAPTLNEAIVDSGVRLPLLRGSMRGFAVSKAFKERYPSRYKKVVTSFRRTLAKKKVQRVLKQYKIGSSWVGPEKSNRLLKEAFTSFAAYNYLFDEER